MTLYKHYTFCSNPLNCFKRDTQLGRIRSKAFGFRKGYEMYEVI